MAGLAQTQMHADAACQPCGNRPHRLPAADRPRLDVDLRALARNWQTVRTAYRGRHLGAVVKYDAYGLGMEAVSQALWRQGCRDFWVESLDEGLALRGHLGGGPGRVFVLNGLAGRDAAREYAAHGLIPVLAEAGELTALRGLAGRAGRRLPVAVQLDTGLTRLGLRHGELERLAPGADIWQDLQPVAWVSHLGHFDALEDARNLAQKQRFEHWTAHLPAAELSLAASSCVFADAGWHYDHARVGSALFGICTTPASPQPLQCVARLRAPVLRVAEVEAGAEIGYGGRYRTSTQRRIATVAMGYGDGLPFQGLERCALWFAGRPAPIVGGIAMGLLSVDVTDFAPDQVRPGTWAEVYGGQQRVEHLAAAAGLASNALLVPTARQARRCYTGAPGEIHGEAY